MSERPAGTDRSKPPSARDSTIAPPVLRAVLYLIAWPACTVALYHVAAPFLGPLGQGYDRYGQSAASFVLVTCDCAAAVGVALLFRVFVDRMPPATLGFNFGAPWLRLFGIGALFGIGMQTVVLALEDAFGFAHPGLARSPGAAFASIASVTPILLLSAIAEEMPIRGYLFQNLSEAWGSWPALVATSLVFAALHLFNPGAPTQLGMMLAGVAAAGALFCLSVIFTGSLWFALGCHVAWNLFEGPLFGFPVSGLSFGSASIVAQTVTGPAWFTGGPFGPEAGASSLIALAAGAIVLIALYRSGVFALPPMTRPFHT
jgi:membrane protease YdiL (CAAX protease family)